MAKTKSWIYPLKVKKLSSNLFAFSHVWLNLLHNGSSLVLSARLLPKVQAKIVWVALMSCYWDRFAPEECCFSDWGTTEWRPLGKKSCWMCDSVNHYKISYAFLQCFLRVRNGSFKSFHRSLKIQSNRCITTTKMH